MKIAFSKYHGCGNDFIIVNEAQFPISILSDLIPKICDRHTGVGADGFILVKTDPLEMIYYNQDGSRAPMCGNGIRCFSKYCMDQGIVHRNSFPVKTLAGIKVVRKREDSLFEVDMGKPDREDLSLVHTRDKIWGLSYQTNENQVFRLYTLFHSTVHTVVFVENLDCIDMQRIGKQICEDRLFAQQTNVNFVQIVDRKHIRMQTYERGCGMTLACGTGACAAVSCAFDLGQCENTVTVSLPKGELQIQIDGQDHVKMIGPAKCIAKGEYIYEND